MAITLKLLKESFITAGGSMSSGDFNILLDIIITTISEGKKTLLNFENEDSINTYFEDKKLSYENIVMAIGLWDVSFILRNGMKNTPEHARLFELFKSTVIYLDMINLIAKDDGGRVKRKLKKKSKKPTKKRKSKGVRRSKSRY